MKKQTLKELQDQLYEVVCRYFGDNKEVKEIISQIAEKKLYLQKQKEKRMSKNCNLEILDKNKKLKISINSLEICEKLLRKEIISNEIMNWEEKNEVLIDSHDEILDALIKEQEERFYGNEEKAR